jgi:hypothetical protein
MDLEHPADRDELPELPGPQRVQLSDSSREGPARFVAPCPAADFETGSVAKGITGLLHVDALERGEIGLSTTRKAVTSHP